MKIALICPSNMLYMPYVINYESILLASGVDYEIVNWDRFHIEDENNFNKYRDFKIGHQRNFLDYAKYKKFILKRLDMDRYDKIIIFGLQLSFFLKNMLLNKYKGNYIIDIRDYNKIIHFFNIKRIVNDSSFTVISSNGYKKWLPHSTKYIINHNTKINSLAELKRINLIPESDTLNIACIGAIRDYEINIDFINSLKNNRNIYLYFHGEGDINKDISDYLEKNMIRNVLLTGRYEKEEESELYRKSSLINVLRYNDGINNQTALPNRLYNAALYERPIIGFKGTYLSNIIEKYNLGLVIDSFDGIENILQCYLNNFDVDNYQQGRIAFFRKVIEENDFFRENLLSFIKK